MKKKKITLTWVCLGSTVEPAFVAQPLLGLIGQSSSYKLHYDLKPDFMASLPDGFGLPARFNHCLPHRQMALIRIIAHWPYWLSFIQLTTKKNQICIKYVQARLGLETITTLGSLSVCLFPHIPSLPFPSHPHCLLPPFSSALSQHGSVVFFPFTNWLPCHLALKLTKMATWLSVHPCSYLTGQGFCFIFSS